MSDINLARIEGEIFGLKTLLVTCLASLAKDSSNSAEYLKKLQETAIAGVTVSRNENVAEAQQGEFQAAAATIIAQSVGAIGEVLKLSSKQ